MPHTPGDRISTPRYVPGRGDTCVSARAVSEKVDVSLTHHMLTVDGATDFAAALATAIVDTGVTVVPGDWEAHVPGDPMVVGEYVPGIGDVCCSGQAIGGEVALCLSHMTLTPQMAQWLFEIVSNAGNVAAG